MTIDNSYLLYIEELMKTLGIIRIKKMFGGAGVYCNELFFALIAEETLYFKVDDSNRPDFEAADMPPFKPFEDKDTVMSYYEVPSQVLESQELLHLWAKKALDVAQRSHKPKRKQ